MGLWCMEKSKSKVIRQRDVLIVWTRTCVPSWTREPECARTSVPDPESSYQQTDTKIAESRMKRFNKFITTVRPLSVIYSL